MLLADTPSWVYSWQFTVALVLAMAAAATLLLAAFLVWLSDRHRPAAPVVCPNPGCRYRGVPRREPRGNVLAACVLCLFFVPLGLAYAVATRGWVCYCPECGTRVASDGPF